MEGLSPGLVCAAGGKEMNAIVPRPITTTEQLLALEDDGVERELIRGRLWERPRTRRNFRHSGAEAKITFLLVQWLNQQPIPRGRILSGEAGFRLLKDPDTTVGIDVAYMSAELAAATPPAAALVDGIPILAVEILSPSDKHEDITAKVGEYLAAGVPVTWVVDPDFRTVSVYRPGQEPEMFNVRAQLSGDPHLPGFQVAVAELFD
jgi:Uma2 family endonuclease